MYVPKAKAEWSVFVLEQHISFPIQQKFVIQMGLLLLCSHLVLGRLSAL